MKTILTTISFVLTLCVLWAQQYDGVYMEKRKIDKNNAVFTIDRQFIYDYYIVINADTLQLDLNERDTFSFLPYGHQSIQNKEIELFVVKPQLFRRTNKKQTEMKYTWQSSNSNYELFTGVVENDSNVWIHPIRHGFFRSLETCPFPYLRKGLQEGSKWRDSMFIGDHWSNPFWAEWTGIILQRYEYQYVGKTKIHVGSVEYICHKIEAHTNSELGQSALTAYYSDQFGFVKLDYSLANGIKVIFDLKEVKHIDGKQ